MLKQMKAVIAATTVFGLGGLIAPSGTTEGGTTMVVEPTELEPGDTFRISNASGSECLGGQVIGDTGGMIAGGASAWFATPDETGDWEVTLQVPTEGPPDAMGNPTPFEGGEFEMHAFCDLAVPDLETTGLGAPAQQDPGFTYDPVTVTVVVPAQEPEPEPEPEPAPEPAPEAAPTVVAAPTYTG